MKTLFETLIGTMLVGFAFYMLKSLIIAVLLYWSWPIIMPAIFTTGVVASAIDFPIALVIGMLICFNQVSISK
jgi:hypothetical protein